MSPPKKTRKPIDKDRAIATMAERLRHMNRIERENRELRTDLENRRKNLPDHYQLVSIADGSGEERAEKAELAAAWTADREELVDALEAALARAEEAEAAAAKRARPFFSPLRSYR